tara:strand:+ start:212 stop:727 length:516 start_codon:yes stop_codon:yes gene_type:complete
MKLQPIIILLAGLLVSCSNNPNSDRPEPREMFAFNISYVKDASDSLAFQRPYRLQILDQDTVLIYKYSYSVDSTKNMIFRFNPETQILTLGPFDLEKVEAEFFKNGKLTQNHFDLYDLKIPVTDGNGPMLFNQEYGVLNVDNSFWSYHYLFLPEGQKNAELAEKILKKLKE